LRVWPVPHPQAARARQQQQQQQQQQAEGPLVLSVPPVAFASSAALGGSMPSVVDWLPAAPHDLLAVGCWDGSVALFRLLPNQPAQPVGPAAGSSTNGTGSTSSTSGMYGMELLCHYFADVLPLRALRWVPPAACQSTVDGLERYLILTGGHEGTLRLWDLR